MEIVEHSFLLDPNFLINEKLPIAGAQDDNNSIMETVHLLSSKANADRLYESIRQMKKGETVNHDLIED